ncbi:hypothetical protein [Spirosoma jeollabukense]
MVTDLCTQRLDSVIIQQVKDFIKADELEPALTDFFVTRNEAALQYTYAKILVGHLLNDWLPTNKFVFEKLIHLQNINYVEIKVSDSGDLLSVTEIDTSVPDFAYVRENLTTVSWLHQTLEGLNRIIIHQIRQFAPDLYTNYRNTFYDFINLKDYNIIAVDQEPLSKETEVKLKWNCKPAIAGYIISELIRAGYIEPPVRRGDLNLKELARICDQLFEFKDYKPGVDGWRNNVDQTRNELTEIPRAKLKLHDLDQLS